MTLVHHHQDFDVDVLIEEARRRQRRRWLFGAGAIALLAVTGIALALSGAFGGDHVVTSLSSQAEGGSRLAVNSQAMRGHGDLAYVSLGELFVLDGSTGRVINVTGPNSAASDPAFSPNRRWLLYKTSWGEQSWLARANGTDRHKLSGIASWLPNGQLGIANGTTTSAYALSSSGALRRTGGTSQASAVASGRSTIYLFTVDTLRINRPKSSQGVVEVQTATSPNGRRTLWYSTRVFFTAAGGLQGTFVSPVAALPGSRGLLLTINHFCCDYADGQPLYELLTPGGQPKVLAVVLGGSEIPSYGPNGTFALAAGGDRYAWAHKVVEICKESTGKCAGVPTPEGSLTVAPAWSPNQATLAYVEAKAEPEGAIGQPQINQWYATHHLVLLRRGSKSPVEVPYTQGAASPIWSADSKSLLFVRNDELFLIPRLGARPIEVAGPLFNPKGWWTSYYGEIDWNAEFAWSGS